VEEEKFVYVRVKTLKQIAELPNMIKRDKRFGGFLNTLSYMEFTRYLYKYCNKIIAVSPIEYYKLQSGKYGRYRFVSSSGRNKRIHFLDSAWVIHPHIVKMDLLGENINGKN